MRGVTCTTNPCVLSSCTALATSSAFLAQMYTLAPAAHSCSTIARPMPFVPPVTRALRPGRPKRRSNAARSAATKGIRLRCQPKAGKLLQVRPLVAPPRVEPQKYGTGRVLSQIIIMNGLRFGLSRCPCARDCVALNCKTNFFHFERSDVDLRTRLPVCICGARSATAV